MATEETVRNAITVWLNRVGFDLVYVAATRGRPPEAHARRGRPRNVKPPDIIGKKRGQNYYYYIEAKGGSVSKKKLYEVIGEIMIQRARTTPARYGIGLPIAYKEAVLDVLSFQAWTAADFYLIFVKADTVTELRPTRANFTRLNKL